MDMCGCVWGWESAGGAPARAGSFLFLSHSIFLRGFSFLFLPHSSFFLEVQHWRSHVSIKASPADLLPKLLRWWRAASPGSWSLSAMPDVEGRNMKGTKKRRRRTKEVYVSLEEREREREKRNKQKQGVNLVWHASMDASCFSLISRRAGIHAHEWKQKTPICHLLSDSTSDLRLSFLVNYKA